MFAMGDPRARGTPTTVKGHLGRRLSCPTTPSLTSLRKSFKEEEKRLQALLQPAAATHTARKPPTALAPMAHQMHTQDEVLTKTHTCTMRTTLREPKAAYQAA